MAGWQDPFHFGVEAPNQVFRVSNSSHAPMSLPPVSMQGTGRFDDLRDTEPGVEPRYGVLYCGTTQIAAFIEVLATHRQDLSTIADVERHTIMDVEERHESRRLIRVARDAVVERWISTRVLTSATLATIAPLFNLADAGAVQMVREELSLTLLALGLNDLDFSHVLGDNRDLTSAISRWIWSMSTDSGQPLFSGIRYRSRFDPECLCIALYQDRYQVQGEVNVQPITPETPGFAEAASLLRLEIS